uniref:Uncharacterized protein n=1 Tax=Salix viminalis TaxID=40686 RepID=A0A6N2L536_SALVM
MFFFSFNGCDQFVLYLQVAFLLRWAETLSLVVSFKVWSGFDFYRSTFCLELVRIQCYTWQRKVSASLL